MRERLTVVCAVWHRQRHLSLFLRQHLRSVRGQTEAVRVIYVVDGGLDLDLPDDDRVSAVRVDRPIAYPEALMVGLALTDTEYFAACNIDDHWFTDATARQLDLMDAHLLDACGGDWEIRFTPDADVDRACMDLSALPLSPRWPPVPADVPQRLGSGDGASGTLGPAPIFRTAAVRRVGGYPRHFGDGTPVNTIVDFILWDRLARDGRRIGRIPMVVGTYLSDPAHQLEFRNGGDAVVAEHERYERHGALL